MLQVRVIATVSAKANATVALTADSGVSHRKVPNYAAMLIGHAASSSPVIFALAIHPTPE
jgi:hypothetical protein